MLLRFLFFTLLFLVVLPVVTPLYAAEPSLPSLTVINPVRGPLLGLEGVNLLDSLKGQWEPIESLEIPATWLWQYSAMEDKQLTDFAKKEMKEQEFGIFLEIDRNSAEKAGVNYHSVGPWYFSDGLLLVSYEQAERERLIDTSFQRFKEMFGYYPKTVGAWWVGAESIIYMQKKYGIIAVLQCADQFSTDRYSLWGTPWSIPYAPSLRNAAIPAESSADKIPGVVILQWAARDPGMAYGDGPPASMYSMQDKSEIPYISYLINIYLKKPLDQLAFGLESGFPAHSYNVSSPGSYMNRLEMMKQWAQEDRFVLQTASAYAHDFLKADIILPPTSYFLTKDYENSDQSFWYNSPAYRFALQKKGDEVLIIDIRDYLSTSTEEFYILPNTQGMIRVNPTAVLDTLRFPNEKILIAKTDKPLTIKEEKSQIKLFIGDKLLAAFSPTEISFTPENKSTETITFARPFSFSIGSGVILIVLLYIGYMILVYRKNLERLLVSLFCLGLFFVVLSPVYTSGKFFTDTMFFSAQSLLLLPLLSHFPFTPSLNIALLLQVFPLAFIIIFHFFLTKKLTNVLLLLVSFLSVFLLLSLFNSFETYSKYIIEYFFISKKAKMVVLLICISFGLSVFFFLKLYQKKKEKVLLFIFLLLSLMLIFVSREKLFVQKSFVITPFELAALEKIAVENSSVISVQPEISPIYQSVRPLLAEDKKYAEFLTSVSWENISQAKANDAFLQKNVLIYIPRYLGADLYSVEDTKDGGRKIFDNGQIGIFKTKTN